MQHFYHHEEPWCWWHPHGAVTTPSSETMKYERSTSFSYWHYGAMNECYPCYPGQCYYDPCAGMPLPCSFPPSIEGFREPTEAELREAVEKLERKHTELAAEQLLLAEKALKLLSS